LTSAELELATLAGVTAPGYNRASHAKDEI